MLLTWEFSNAGYIVNPATDGREAIQKIGADQPAVVVLDLATRVLNGIDAVSSIPNLQTRSAVVIYSDHERCRYKYVKNAAKRDTIAA